ncbi:MAG TPA: hypothetical protein VI384_04410 [Candidatus Dormibacteraeota bacterium]
MNDATDPANWSPAEREMAGCEDDRPVCGLCGLVIADGDERHGCGREVWHAVCDGPCVECDETKGAA